MYKHRQTHALQSGRELNISAIGVLVLEWVNGRQCFVLPRLKMVIKVYYKYEMNTEDVSCGCGGNLNGAGFSNFLFPLT